MHPKFIATRDADGRIVDVRKPSADESADAVSAYWEMATEAINSGDFDSLKKVIDVLAPNQRSPEKLGGLLHHVWIPWVAIQPRLYTHSAKIVRFLVAAGADIDHRRENGQTLLFYLSSHNTCGSDELGSEPVNLPYSEETVIPTEVHRQYLELANAILKSGADPNIVIDSSGEPRTALWMATQRPDRSLIKLLLKHGADPLMPPSALALARAQGTSDIIDLLSG
jgi:hypothetical protein